MSASSHSHPPNHSNSFLPHHSRHATKVNHACACACARTPTTQTNQQTKKKTTMSTTTPIRPLLRAQNPRTIYTQRRTFLPNPFSISLPTSSPAQPQVLTASRTLPYPAAPVYSIIADVPSYASFLPYCHRSSITRWSSPDRAFHRRWPSEGVLTTGWGGLDESFVSRVYCVPGRFVESVGGQAGTSLQREDIRHHIEDEGVGEEEKEEGARRTGKGSEGLLTHLRSKWSVSAVSEDSTQVDLSVEFAFSNPLYAALSGNVAPKVAEFMVRAFEKRVQEVLERNPEMIKASLGDMDGSRMKT